MDGLIKLDSQSSCNFIGADSTNLVMHMYFLYHLMSYGWMFSVMLRDQSLSVEGAVVKGGGILAADNSTVRC